MTKNKIRRPVGRLVLVRHGQSDWNQKNLFTGWTDVDLTEQGREEARQAGRTLTDADLSFDIAFTSVLTRAIRTLWIVLDEMKLMWIPVENSWRLNERHPRHDPRYAGLPPSVLPSTESLKTTLARVQPYWEDRIAPEILRGRNVLVAAHGNSLRAVVKMLEGISDEEITELNIPTGVPRLYELDAALKPKRAEYLGDPAAIAAAAAAVANQAKAKR